MHACPPSASAYGIAASPITDERSRGVGFRPLAVSAPSSHRVRASSIASPARRSGGRDRARSLAEPGRGRRDRRRGPARRDIVFWKNKGRDSLKNRISAAVAAGERGWRGSVRLGGLRKRENDRRRRQAFDFVGNRQGKCLEFLGISLEKFGISLEELGFSLERLGKIWSSWTRHARPCAGHPRRAAAAAQASPDSNPAAWMAGTSPAMTGDRTGIGLPIYPP